MSNLHVDFAKLVMGGQPPEGDDEFENPGFEPEQKECKVKQSFQLMPHQVEALEWMRAREADVYFPSGMLGMLMGLGKTFTSLSIIHETTKAGPTLVVCPKTAIYTWEEQVEKFYGDSLNVLVFRKDRAKLDVINKDILLSYDVIVTNYEYIRSLVKTLNLSDKIEIKEGVKIVGMNIPTSPLMNVDVGEALLFSHKWNRIIADESHNFSNNKTSLWRSMMCLAGTHRWCLTGTPIRNYDNDIYSQFKWMGYRDRRFNPSGFRKLALQRFIHFVDYDKAGVQLPQVHFNKETVQLEGEQKEMYSYYLKSAREAFRKYVAGCRTFTCVLVMFLRLRQACVAPYTITPLSNRNQVMTEEQKQEYMESQREIAKELPHLIPWLNNRDSTAGARACKIVRTIEILLAVPAGEKAVVFTMFPRAIDLMMECLGDRKSYIHIDGSVTGKNRDHALHSFKYGDTEVLFISYKVGSESLNLTEAYHIILLEGWWSNAVLEQAKSRVCRMGQSKPIHIHQLIVSFEEGQSIETSMMALCLRKKEIADKFLESGKIGGEGEGINAEMLQDILF